MLLGQHAKATSRSRSRQAPAGWQGKQDPVETHPRKGSTKVKQRGAPRTTVRPLELNLEPKWLRTFPVMAGL